MRLLLVTKLTVFGLQFDTVSFGAVVKTTNARTPTEAQPSDFLRGDNLHDIAEMGN